MSDDLSPLPHTPEEMLSVLCAMGELDEANTKLTAANATLTEANATLTEANATLMVANTPLSIALDGAGEQIATLQETIHALTMRLEAWEAAHEGL